MTRSARTLCARAALAAGLVLLSVRAAFPHAEVLRSTPAAGAIITAAPARIHIWFSEPVEAPSPTAVAVFGPDGARADQAATAVSPDDATELTTTVNAEARGTYTVRWRAVSADGHPINGTFQFSVGAASAAAAPIETAAQPSGVEFQAAGRWLHLVALSLVTGALVLMLIVGTEQTPELDQRLWRLGMFGALGLMPAAAVMLAAQSAAVAGTITEGLRAESVRGLLGTDWGALWGVRTALGAALALVMGWGARRSGGSNTAPAILGLALTGGVVLATSLNGHPAATNPVWLSVAIDWAHTAATAAWVGGLLALLTVILPSLKRAPAKERASALATIAPRFSTVAVVCVQVLVLTGLYQTWAHVSEPAALTATRYGVTLLIKLALVGATVLTAAVNLFVLKPRFAAALQGLTDRPGALSTFGLFRRVVGAEVMLVVAILGTAGVLTSLPPATAAAAAPAMAISSVPEPEMPPAIVLADHAGATMVTLSLGSALVGSNRATIALHGGVAEPAPQVRLRIEPPPSSGMSPSTITPDKVGAFYRATLPLAPAGSWGISVLVTSGAATEAAAFRIELPLRGAGELLALADERMNALRSAVEDVEIFTDGVRSEQRNEYQAPDRRRRTGDLLEITTGDRHFMRHGTQWHSQTVEPFQWPAFRYAEKASNITVVGRETLNGTECFVVSFEDSADGSRTRLWIATGSFRVLQQMSAAPGRFTVSRFSRYDAGARITPPS